MSNIRVALRVRPLSDKEKDEGSKEIVNVKDNSVIIENVKVLGLQEFGDTRVRLREFMFDHCYDCIQGDTAQSSQAKIFKDLGSDVLRAAYDGFNACVFAYGQTGTGKTHTMMGNMGDVGLIPRICEGLFEHMDQCTDEHVTCRIDISYFEIYNERVRDLLQPELLKNNENYSLKVREHPKDGPYVKDLSWHCVRNNQQIQALLERGNEYRVTAETYMHGHSSRSHAIVTVCFTQARLEENRPSEIVSKINLVDLAGSERADPSSKPDFRKRLTEGANINKSLVTLGYVIKSLAERSLLSWSSEEIGSSGGGEASAGSSPAGSNKQRVPYIPYRDSVLTWLLKDSLGGNSKTIMIATITPASQYYNESISTLRYAQRAKNIINKPRINEDGNVALIRELRREINRLHGMLADAQKPTLPPNSLPGDIIYFVPSLQGDNCGPYDQGGNMVTLQDSEDSIIAEKLHENEEMAKQLTKSWMCKWSSTHDIMKESDLSIRGLRNRSSSMGVMIDSQLPYLVGMDEDILSTGIVIFHLKEGDTTVGREDSDKEPDIVLHGPTIEKDHCIIRHVNGDVYLHPCPGSMCAVQGLESTEPTKLSQGDYVVLGGNQVFRFNNPSEAAKLRENRRSQNSLNTLNTSYVSFGGLSRASSYSSIGGDDVNYLSPHSQLARSYPNSRRHSDIVIYAASDLCRDLERRYQSEQERIEEARKELERLKAEHEKAEEVRQLKEEEMYNMHDQHRADIEDQKQHLARLVEENERARAKAEEELQFARESLAQEKEAFQKKLEDDRKQLKELEKQHRESMAIQTEPLSTQSTSVGSEPMETQISATEPMEVQSTCVGSGSPITTMNDEDVVMKELPVVFREGRRLSVKDQLDELDQTEFTRRMSYRETEESLAIQQEDIEDAYMQTQEQIESRKRKLKEMEHEYKELDKEHLQEMATHNEEVQEIRKKEVQLEVYIQEHEELINVGTDQPRPLRGAQSEMFLLDPNLQYHPQQKTGSLLDIQVAESEEMDPMSPRSRPVQRSSSLEAKQGSTSDKADKNVQPDNQPDQDDQDDKDDKMDKKISSVAKQVTSRLYKPPEPKFKYVPKEKVKEVKTVPRTKVVRDRTAEVKPWAQPVKGLRDFDRSKSESPQRVTSKRTSPSPRRDLELKKRSTSAPLKDNKPGTPLKDNKPKKGGSKTKDKNDKDFNDKSKANTVLNTSKKSQSPHRTESPTSRLSGAGSPERRLAVGPNAGRTGPPPLRHMTSASSLASVPESLSEHDEAGAAENKKEHNGTKYGVKKRQKKGRANFLDDGFRCHSAPDSERMSRDFDNYAGKIDSDFQNIVCASISVDDSDICKEENVVPDVTDEFPVDAANGGWETSELEMEAENEQMDDDSRENHNVSNEDQVFNNSINDKGVKWELGDDEAGDDSVDICENVTTSNDENDTAVVLGKREHDTDTSTDIPKKRSKPVNGSVERLGKSKTVENEAFSDDSLDANISIDSLEGNEIDVRLTQSLPNYLFQSDKPVSDDSLSEKEHDTSFNKENVETSEKLVGNSIDDETKTSKDMRQNLNDSAETEKLSRAEVQCYEYNPTSNVSSVLTKSAVDSVNFMPTGECAINIVDNSDELNSAQDNTTLNIESSNTGASFKCNVKEGALKLIVLPNIDVLSETVESPETDEQSKNQTKPDIAACHYHDSNSSTEKNTEAANNLSESNSLPEETCDSPMADKITTSLDKYVSDSFQSDRVVPDNQDDLPDGQEAFYDKYNQNTMDNADAEMVEHDTFIESDKSFTEVPPVIEHDTQQNESANVIVSNLIEDMLQNDKIHSAIKFKGSNSSHAAEDHTDNEISNSDKDKDLMNLEDSLTDIPCKDNTPKVNRDQDETSVDSLNSQCIDNASINVVASNLTNEMFQNEPESALSCERDNNLNRENEQNFEDNVSDNSASKCINSDTNKLANTVSEQSSEGEMLASCTDKSKGIADAPNGDMLASGTGDSNDDTASIADAHNGDMLASGTGDSNDDMLVSTADVPNARGADDTNASATQTHGACINDDSSDSDGENKHNKHDKKQPLLVDENHNVVESMPNQEIHEPTKSQEQSNGSFETTTPFESENTVETGICVEGFDKSKSSNADEKSSGIEKRNQASVESEHHMGIEHKNKESDAEILDADISICSMETSAIGDKTTQLEESLSANTERVFNQQQKDSDNGDVDIEPDFIHNVGMDGKNDKTMETELCSDSEDSNKVMDSEDIDQNVETELCNDLEDINKGMDSEIIDRNRIPSPLEAPTVDNRATNTEEQEMTGVVYHVVSLTRTIGVGTSFDMFDDEEEGEFEGDASQGSNDSFLLDPEKELEVLQEALELLPAKPASGPQLSTSRRAARQRAMIRQQHSGTDSDGVTQLSDSSPYSGTQTKASSRPGSGSRRRKRPSNKTVDKPVKQLNELSSDAYDSSDNDSVYSDDSIDRLRGAGDAGRITVNGNSYLNDNDSGIVGNNSESDIMLSRHKHKQHGRPSASRARPVREGLEVTEESDGKRTVGIQTADNHVRNRSFGRADLSDCDASFASGELGRGMVMSPVSLWTSHDRAGSDSQSDRNSTSSAGIIRNVNDLDISVQTPRSSTRSNFSFSSYRSNLDRGPTEVWSSSATELRPLPNFPDELSYVFESEGMSPSASSLDYSESQQSSVYTRSPQGEKLIPASSTPTNSAKVVNISYPKSQLHKVSKLDTTTPVTFEVVVHEDTTNISYNVEKTEYKTYALRNQTESNVGIIPDRILVNLNESVNIEVEENFVQHYTEDISIHHSDGETSPRDSLVIERSYRSSTSSERETVSENDQVVKDQFSERKESGEENSSTFVSSQSSDSKVPKKKTITLQSSGVVETTNFPSSLPPSFSNDADPGKYDESGACLNESDYTSDYGTITSIEGRKGNTPFTSDSEDNDMVVTSSPNISPRTSFISALNKEQTDQMEETHVIPEQGQQLCSVADVASPLNLLGTTVQSVSSSSIECNSSSEIKQDLENPLNEDNLEKSDPTDEDMETDTSSVSTVMPANIEDDDKFYSQETLNDEASVLGSQEHFTGSSMPKIPKLEIGVSPSTSPRREKKISCSSTDDSTYMSLDQSDVNTSTCSSDYKTPQQSPRNGSETEGAVSRQVEDVFIPDYYAVEKLQTTPRETVDDIALDQAPVLTSSPKQNNEVRTVSVNTESVPSSTLSAPPAISISSLFGNANNPVQTEALRKELEKKIDKLQRHVRSLSDSAISSDFTDGDSSSLSPRGSRVYDDKIFSGDRALHSSIGHHHVKAFRLSHSQARGGDGLNFESSPAKKLPFKDSGNVFDGEDGDTEKCQPTQLQKGKELQLTKEHFSPSVGAVSAFPERLIHALLAVKPYPLHRSASLDSLSTIINLETQFSRAVRGGQSTEEITALNLADVNGNARNENDNLISSSGLSSTARSQSPGEIGMNQDDINDLYHALESGERPVGHTDNQRRKVTEKCSSMYELEGNHEREYLRSLSESNIDDFDQMNTSNDSNDSITFVFIGDTRPASQEVEEDTVKESDLQQDPYLVNISGRGHPTDDSEDRVSDVLSRSASDDSVLERLSTHTASEEIEEIICRKDNTEQLESVANVGNSCQDVSPPSYTDTSDGFVQNRHRVYDDDDSEPLRHKFGIDESVLPISERSVSADNIPKHLMLMKDLHRSRSTGMIAVGATNDNTESESGIFPPRPISSCADGDPTNQSLSMQTMSDGGLEKVSPRTFSDIDASFSNQTSDNVFSNVSDGEENSSAIVKSICSNSSSIESFEEEFILTYRTSVDRASRNTSVADDVNSDGEVDPMLDEEQHLREVLETVQRLIMPGPTMVDRGVSTTDPDASLNPVSIGLQTTSSETSTQTADNATMQTVIQPHHIILPALAAPFRSQSVDSFGLGTNNEQQLELSEGSKNWCTLGELMVETTHLLRRINDRLPEQQDKTTSEEKQASQILQQWREISIQTGRSLNNLTTVGLQTDETDYPVQTSSKQMCSESTQVDTEMKLDPLVQCEVETNDMMPYGACNVSIQTEEDSDEENDVIKSDEDDAAVASMKPVSNAEDNDVVKSDEDDEALTQSVNNNKKTSKKPGTNLDENDVVKSDEDDEALTQSVSNNKKTPKKPGKNLDKNDVVKSDEDDEAFVPSVNGNTELCVSKPATSSEKFVKAKFIPQVKAELGLDKKPSDDESVNMLAKKSPVRTDGVDKTDAPARKVLPGFTLPNTPEIEELRKEHAKLMENLKKASDDRKSRKDQLQARKKPLSDSKNEEKMPGSSEPAIDFGKIQDTTKPSQVESVKKNIDSKPENSDSEDIVRSDDDEIPLEMSGTKSRSETDSSDPGDIVQIKIQTDPNTGVKVENKTYKKPLTKANAKERNSASPVGTKEQHTWEIEGPQLRSIQDIRPVSESEENGPHDDEESSLEIDDVLSPRHGSEPVLSDHNVTVEEFEIVPDKHDRNEHVPNVKTALSEHDDTVEEFEIIPDKHKRNEHVPDVKALLNDKGKPSEENSLDSDDSKSSEPRKRGPNKPVVVKCETSPKLKAQRLREQQMAVSPELLEPVEIISDEVAPVNHSHTETMPVRSKKPVRFADDCTQMSVEFLDDGTQTDPEPVVEDIISPKSKENALSKPTNAVPKPNLHHGSPEIGKSSPTESQPPQQVKEELESLQVERQHIMDLLGLSYLPNSLTVELLEAKLNYCIGQTDLLLDNLDDYLEFDSPKKPIPEQSHTKDYISKYRADLKKSKEDIEECRQHINKGRGRGAGRGRTPFRRRDMLNQHRQAEVDAFRLERLREQQDYERSRHGTPTRGNTPLKGTTPLYGNSPVVTPRSDVSRSASPNSPGFMKPRDHKLHLVELRKQLINDVVEEEIQHSRSCSPSLLNTPPVQKHRSPSEQSLGFSPKVSVSATDMASCSSSSSPSPSGSKTYAVLPGCTSYSPVRRSAPSPSGPGYRQPSNPYGSYQNSPERTPGYGRPSSDVFTPQESEQILREIEEMKRNPPSMSTPMEEMLRRSSFSSTGSQMSSPSRPEMASISPRSRSNPRLPSQHSPLSRPTDNPLSLNLDCLQDDVSGPYSPYSAYAREHIIPNERSSPGGILRGTFELYQDHSDTSSVLSCDSDTFSDSGQRHPGTVDEDTIKRLRPIRADDIKARINRHKR